MPSIELYHFGIWGWLEQLMNRQRLLQAVIDAVEVNWREIELRDDTLHVLFTLIAESHLWKNWTSHTNHELRHLKDLFGSIGRVCKGLWVNLLCNSVKVAEDDPTLWESKHPVEGALVFHHVNEVFNDLLKAMHYLRWRSIVFIPVSKLEPGTEMCTAWTQKS